MFMDFLKSLSMFGEKAPPERIQELIEIIEDQADLDAQFDVSILFYYVLLNQKVPWPFHALLNVYISRTWVAQCYSA